MAGETTSDDMGAYELELPQNFDHRKFEEDAAGGAGRFWLIRVQPHPLHGCIPEYVKAQGPALNSAIMELQWVLEFL